MVMIKRFIYFGFLVLFLLLLKLFFEQATSFKLGLNDLYEEDYTAAIAHFDRVLNAHLPYSPLEKMAIEHLISIKEISEKNGHLEMALLCVETIRTSRYLCRHFWIPDSQSLANVDKEVARLRAKIIATQSPNENEEENFKEQLTLVKARHDPSLPWSMGAGLSFILYLVSTVNWIRKDSRVSLLSSLGFLAIWILCLIKA